MRKVLLFCFAFLFFCGGVIAQKKNAQDVITLALKVDSAFQSRFTFKTDAFWDNAVFHLGNLELFKVAGDKKLLDFTISWAKHNKYMGANSQDKRFWDYRLPLRVNDNVLFADYQICFQIYSDLNDMEPSPEKLKRAFEVFDYQISLPDNDFWWWMDALFMAMPSMTRLYKQSGDEKYLDKMYEYFDYFDSRFYDRDAHLYYRDKRFVYPEAKSPESGKKLFWSRGNGWVFAAHARVLQQLPKKYKHYNVFLDRFLAMADTLKKLQKDEGYWQNSLGCDLLTPGRETSGTALMLYAFCSGVNMGILSRKKYAPVIEKAWKYLSETAVQEDFMVGYIFDVPERTAFEYTPNPKTSTNYGTGVFLLAASEYAKFLDLPFFSKKRLHYIGTLVFQNA